MSAGTLDFIIVGSFLALIAPVSIFTCCIAPFFAKRLAIKWFGSEIV